MAACGAPRTAAASRRIRRRVSGPRPGMSHPEAPETRAVSARRISRGLPAYGRNAHACGNARAMEGLSGESRDSSTHAETCPGKPPPRHGISIQARVHDSRTLIALFAKVGKIYHRNAIFSPGDKPGILGEIMPNDGIRTMETGRGGAWFDYSCRKKNTARLIIRTRATRKNTRKIPDPSARRYAAI